MKPTYITIAPDDLAEGKCAINGRKRIEKVRDLMLAQNAMLLKHRQELVFPTSLSAGNNAPSGVLEFAKPSTFDVAIVVNRDGELNGVTLRHNGAQRTFERYHEYDSKFTLEGDGAGPVVKEGLEESLKALVSGATPAKKALAWLRERTVKKSKEAK